MDSKTFFNKALENLDAARLCLAHNHNNACANRVYYAMFQAALAVLAIRGIVPAQEFIKHDWLHATFSRELINRRKVFPGHFRSYLLDAQNSREKADYTAVQIGAKAAHRLFDKAEEFIAVLAKEATNVATD